MRTQAFPKLSPVLFLLTTLLPQLCFLRPSACQPQTGWDSVDFPIMVLLLEPGAACQKAAVSMVGKGPCLALQEVWQGPQEKRAGSLRPLLADNSQHPSQPLALSTLGQPLGHLKSTCGWFLPGPLTSSTFGLHPHSRLRKPGGIWSKPNREFHTTDPAGRTGCFWGCEAWAQVSACVTSLFCGPSWLRFQYL